MKYNDLKYYINKDFVGLFESKYDGEKIRQIRLSKDLFWILVEELCDSYVETTDRFEHDGIMFKLGSGLYPSYAIVDVVGLNFGYGYEILSEEERIIKNLLE